MGVFDGLKSARAMVQNSWYHEGRFLVFVERCVWSTNRKKLDQFTIESKVILVLDAGGYPKMKKIKGVEQLVQPLRPGLVATHMTTSDKESFWSNIRSMIGQLLECIAPGTNAEAAPDEEWPGLAEAATGKDQILSRQFVIVNATEKTTKGGNPFTVINYECGITPAQVREMLAAAGILEEQSFPKGELQAMIDSEAAKAAAQTAA